MQVSIDLQAHVSVAKAWLVSLVLFVFHQCKLGLCFSKRNQIPKLNKEILGNWLELCCCCCFGAWFNFKDDSKREQYIQAKTVVVECHMHDTCQDYFQLFE